MGPDWSLSPVCPAEQGCASTAVCESRQAAKGSLPVCGITRHRGITVPARSFRLLKGLLAAAALAGSSLSWGASSLGTYNVNPNTVTVSGISSGGYMAVQLQVAYSAHFHGAAIFAGGAYYCARDLLALTYDCTNGIAVPVPDLVSYTKQQANAGHIDPTNNIAGKPIYMFSGLLDTVNAQQAMDDLYTYYTSFTSSSNINYNNTTAAEHSWVTPDGPNPCYLLLAPYLNNCGFDAEQTFLTMFYGTLKARTAAPQGTYVQFDQDVFCPGSNCAAIGMDHTGWLYVPHNCAAGDACKLAVVLHGCLMNQGNIGTALVTNSGINEWGDNNNILVLHPQTIDTVVPNNPGGCWDWWGYTDANYALRTGKQMQTIMSMINHIIG